MTAVAFARVSRAWRGPAPLKRTSGFGESLPCLTKIACHPFDRPRTAKTDVGHHRRGVQAGRSPPVSAMEAGEALTEILDGITNTKIEAMGPH